MSIIPEQSQELYQERLATQAETNIVIDGLISQVKTNDKKFLPYGPIFMNLYKQQEISAHRSALQQTINQTQKIFCDKKCNGKESCLNVCASYFNFAVGYTFDHFKRVHKYSYQPTIEAQEQ